MSETDWSHPGSGLSAAHLKPAVSRRIEWLGKMNDTVNKCFANNNNLGLLELANEYEEHGMIRTANHLRLAVSESEQK